MLREVTENATSQALREGASRIDRRFARDPGFAVSFAVALGVVEWFLLWVRRHGFVVFAVYRIILGSLLLAFGAKLIGA